MYKFTFTVFTPTFNNAHKLYRVYESLKAQTFRDFEWLIVDDGSTDNTPELVKKYRSEAHFPIYYIGQKNQGKHIATNLGAEKAQGEFFVSLDSDDALTPNALERFKYHWDSIPVEQKCHYSSVTGLSMLSSGELATKKYPSDIIDCNSLEMTYRYKIKGDTDRGCSRTEVVRMFPYPTDMKTKFIQEGIVARTIAEAGFLERFVNEALYIFYDDKEKNSHRLTKQSPAKFADTHALLHKLILNNEIKKWFFYSPCKFLKSSVHFSRFSFHSGDGFLKQYRSLNNIFAKIIWLIGSPFGLAVYIRDIILYKKSHYFNILSKQKHPVRFLLYKIFMMLGISKFFVIRKNSYILRFYPSALSTALWLDPSYDKGDELFYQRYLLPGDIVIDVGANIGSLTLEASAIVLDNGKVYAIEAHPKIFAYLQGNIRLNHKSNIKSFHYVLGNRDGEISFQDTTKHDDTQNSVSTSHEGIKLPMKRLDSLPISEARISLLKVDVEGYELFVFHGAKKILEHTDCIYFESWKQHFLKYNYTCKDIFTFLSDMGFFVLRRIQDDNNVVQINKDYVSTSLENLIATKDIDTFINRTQFNLL